MKTEIKILAFVLAGVFIMSMAFAAVPESESVGVEAAKAVKQMRKDASQSYKVASDEAAKANQQFQVIANDAMKNFTEQADKALRNLQIATQEMMAALNREIEKFNKTMSEPDNTAPQTQPSV